MSRWGIKMGLLVVLTTLLIVATVNTVKAEETIVNFTDNNILVARLKIMDASYNETTKTINVSYKDTFKIKIEAINTSKAKDGKIDILIYRFADPKPIKVKEWNDMVVGKVITINTTEMKPALYYIMIRFIEKGPNNITTSKELISYKETDTNPKFNISITCKKPIIEKCKVKNQKESVTIGDNLVIDVTVWGTNEVEWYFKRWEDYRGIKSYENLTWGNVRGKYNYVSELIKVNTFELFNNQTLNAQPGKYEIVIKAGEAKYSLEVEIEKPYVTASVDEDTVIPGGSITIRGETNLEETGSVKDENGDNKVYIFVFNTAEFSKDDIGFNVTNKTF